MTHDRAADAAAYVAGELDHSACDDFENHLIDCEQCWAEVEAGRAGRAIAEAGREVAPVHLRDSIRALVAAAPLGSAPLGAAREQAPADPVIGTAIERRRVPGRLLVAAASVALLLAGLVVATHRPEQPSAIRAAVAGFREQRLPGRGIPLAGAPDLGRLSMRSIGAGSGSLEGQQVTAYAYRDDQGRRLLIYVSDEAFPTARGAVRQGSADGPWIVETDEVTVLCARRPHALLVLGEDTTLVRAAADALDVT